MHTTSMLVVLLSLARVGGAADLPEARFLTREAGVYDVWPAISPDGERVVFCRTTDLASFELMSIPIGGGEAEAVLKAPPPFQPTRPNWHWDSNRILLTGMNEGGEARVRMIDGGGEALNVPHPDAVASHAFYPCWAPDGGSYIVTEFDAQFRGVIKRVTIATGEVEALTDPDEVLAGRAWESVDGSIVFAGQFNERGAYDQTQNQILRLTPDGGVEAVSPGVGRAPSVSPDGRWIAYESPEGGGTGRYAIFVVASAGGEPIRLTEYADAQHPLWTPDGSSIVCFMRLPEGEPGFGLVVLEGVELP